MWILKCFFNMHLLNTYDVLGIVLGAEDKIMNRSQLYLTGTQP